MARICMRNLHRAAGKHILMTGLRLNIFEDAFGRRDLEIPQFIMSQIREEEPMLPTDSFKFNPTKRELYPEEQRTESCQKQDSKLETVWIWLKNPIGNRPEGMDDHAYRNFMQYARQFFVDKKGRLFRKGPDSTHKLVVGKEHRMYMMRAAHDSLGHRGVYATKSLIELRFWWPEFERDLAWYIKTCPMCQV